MKYNINTTIITGEGGNNDRVQLGNSGFILSSAYLYIEVLTPMVDEDNIVGWNTSILQGREGGLMNYGLVVARY